jgi:predicted GIY-YIG superfamily endonuclease
MEKLLPSIKLKANWPTDFVPDEIREFKEITKNFSGLLDRLTDPTNVISIYDNFGKSGLGKATSRNLLKSLIIELENNKDFKGIYLFWLDNEPFYTGISRGVIKRIHQHIKGSNHFSSSLSYTMGKELHKEFLDVEHTGTRKELDFDKFSAPFKEILKKQCQVSILPINGSTELYLFEVYAAVQLKLHYYNKFKTH